MSNNDPNTSNVTTTTTTTTIDNDNTTTTTTIDNDNTTTTTTTTTTIDNDNTTTTTTTTTFTIVVTGASGYLGQHIIRSLLELNDDSTTIATATVTNKRTIQIYALVHTSITPKEYIDSIDRYYYNNDASHNNQPKCRRRNPNIQIQILSVDITTPETNIEWDTIVKSNSNIFDVCIHTAAMSNPSKCQHNNPNVAYNINVPKVFLQQLIQYHPTIHIIALSTDQVYDGNRIKLLEDNTTTTIDDDRNNNNNNNTYYTESSKCDPCNVYGQTKVAMEEYLYTLYQQQQQQQQQHSTNSITKKSGGCQITILRSSIICGPLAPFIESTHTTFLHFCHEQILKQIPTTYYTNEIRSIIATQNVIDTIFHFICFHPNSTITSSKTNHDDDNDTNVLLHNHNHNNNTYEIYCMGGPKPYNRYEIAIGVASYIDDNIKMLDGKRNQNDNDTIDGTTAVVPTTSSSTSSSSSTTSTTTKWDHMIIPTIKSTVNMAVPSPLNISMNSNKLYNELNHRTTEKTAMKQYNNNNNVPFLSLSEMIKDTFLL